MPCHQYSVVTTDTVRLMPKWQESSSDFLMMSALSPDRGTSCVRPSAHTLCSSPLVFTNLRTLLLIRFVSAFDAYSDMSPITRRCMHMWSANTSRLPPCSAPGLAASPLCTREHTVKSHLVDKTVVVFLDDIVIYFLSLCWHLAWHPIRVAGYRS